MEVPTIYKAYVWGLCKGIAPQNMAKHMVLTYLHLLDPGITIFKFGKPSISMCHLYYYTMAMS